MSMIRCCTWINTCCKVDYPSEVMPDYEMDDFPYYNGEYDIPDLIDENPPVTTARYFEPQIVTVGTRLHPVESRWHEVMCTCNIQRQRQEERERNRAVLNSVRSEARKDDMIELDSDYI